MRKIAILSAGLGALLACMLPGTSAEAQAPTNFRSWVASNGTDSLCTRDQPCGTFLAAHNATVAGGEINCVDAGDFSKGSPLSISKSITIDCGGTFGATIMGNIQVSGTGIVVRLRNLSLQGFD